MAQDKHGNELKAGDKVLFKEALHVVRNTYSGAFHDVAIVSPESDAGSAFGVDSRVLELNDSAATLDLNPDGTPKTFVTGEMSQNTEAVNAPSDQT
jgi:hypothetical protein